MRHEGTSAQYREREYNTHAYGLFIVTSQSVPRSNEPLWLFFSFFSILPRKENVYDLSHLRIIRSPQLRIQHTTYSVQTWFKPFSNALSSKSEYIYIYTYIHTGVMYIYTWYTYTEKEKERE